MAKPNTLRIHLTDEQMQWVASQADDIGCDPATWIRMLVVAASKGRNAPTPPVAMHSHAVWPQPYPTAGHVAQMPDDAWRGDPNAEDNPDVRLPSPPAEILPFSSEVRTVTRVPPPYSPHSVVGSLGAAEAG